MKYSNLLFVLLVCNLSTIFAGEILFYVRVKPDCPIVKDRGRYAAVDGWNDQFGYDIYWMDTYLSDFIHPQHCDKLSKEEYHKYEELCRKRLVANAASKQTRE